MTITRNSRHQAHSGTLISPRAAAAFLALALTQTVSAQSYSGFTAGTEGWTVTDYPDLGPYTTPLGTTAATWAASGGNPGGYITSPDVSGTTFWFSAPESFLGNHTTSFGGVFRYDLQTPVAAEGVEDYNPAGEGDVLLQSSTLTLIAKNGAVPRLSSWTTLTLDLTTTSAWHKNSMTGDLASNAEIQSVLSDLSAVLIRGEYFAGADQPQLDNVELTSVPEPRATVALSTALLAAMVLWRRFAGTK